ncbi:MAG: hypothetical protein ACRD0U_13820, partial [Acidimicrobiales bacterium]
AVAVLLVVDAVGEPAFRFRGYPVEAVDWLENRGFLASDDRQLLAPDFVGNYLELRYRGDVATFIDDRYDMFPPEVVDDYLTAATGSAGWSSVLDRWDVGTVLWQAALPLAQLLATSEGWRVAYDEGDWLVAVRR